MTANDNVSANDQPVTAPLTSGRLHDLVLDHMLENPELFIVGENINPVDHFTSTLSSLVAMAHKIAAESLANRQCLSPIKTFDGKISANPDDDDQDSQRYELRYRLIEQIGSDKPFKDSVMSYDEAKDIYGENFIDNYWGRLGEHCPRRVTTPGNRTLWFTVVRLPAADQSIGDNETQALRQQSPARSPGPK
ncbi:hypothetical protein [Stutzerimonas stutzeri]|uniref:hypothetical protein n=1 Tax=Stutzerimonas stutzeri TaxID=316 RepID=UPI0015E3811B|nr:hypothetical protein [Stutzerimonas stutzeri]MBA1280331.1 hypothetical protein [Stutzerimonas stutzeri]